MTRMVAGNILQKLVSAYEVRSHGVRTPPRAHACTHRRHTPARRVCLSQPNSPIIKTKEHMGKLAPGLVCNFRTGSVVFDEVFGLGVMSHEDEASKNAAIVFDTQPEGRQSPFINRT